MSAPFAFAPFRNAFAENKTRLVSLDLLPTELLLTLGVAPIAIANGPLYARLVAEPILPKSVNDLGPLNEPNAEFLQALAPDAILASEWQVSGLAPLKRIAPLIPLATIAPSVSAVDNNIDLMNQLADLTETQGEASLWIRRVETELSAARGAVKARAKRPVYICRFSENGRNVALFGGNGMVGDVVKRLGLSNAWQGRVNASGVTSAGIDQLAENPDAIIVHFDRGRETVQAMRKLAASSIWNALPAVRAGRVVAMPVIYPSGGVYSSIRFARQLVESLPADG
ncbi:ABC transporter substrate-binding protein [Mesorhizobium sp. SB112]|uniref:ABC transporter substrate-binding protein n=1 Tax=Mesorhizobium sp. SB112 TaxID=3151853 RepID=UPI003267762B